MESESRNEDRMEFTNSTLAGLMATPPEEMEAAAERANLCMEERIGPARQSVYEDRMGAPGEWEDWRDNHLRYVQEEVRRRYPLSAAFAGGEPSLRPGVEPNQDLSRVERICRTCILRLRGPWLGDTRSAWRRIRIAATSPPS